MANTIGFRLSRGVLNTISPPISQAYVWATEYKPTPSHPLLDVAQGAPGIPPPKLMQAALISAASSLSSFGYCPVFGEPALRKALAEEMKAVYGNKAGVDSEDVALTSGCNLAFVSTVMTLADAGDEVILPVPWYFNHQMDLTLLGIKPVPLQTFPEDGFIPSVERCRHLITPKTKAIALVTPNNPTGAIYPPSLLLSFLELAREKNIALIVDETYRDFVPPPEAPHSLFADPLWRSNLIHLFSFSKSYCVPGHRLGAIIASPTLLTQVETVLDCLQICPPRITQIALADVLPELRGFIQENAEAVRARHRAFARELPRGWEIGSQGGFFAFVKHPFVGRESEELCKRLGEEMGVLGLPDSFFSGTGLGDGDQDGRGWEKGRWIRFSVANVDDAQIGKVCERLSQCGQRFGWAE